MNIILQPCGSTEAKKHFRDTIVSPVGRAVLEDYLSPSVLSRLDRFAD